jgi:PQQ-dependent catabolism-associated CXXCW motif protein
VRWILVGLACVASSAAASEASDHGVPPQAELRRGDYDAPTPLAVPGARTVTTAELRRLLQRSDAARPVLVDVLGGEGHASLPGAAWLPGAGRGEAFDDGLQARLAQALAVLTGDDRARALVFFCAGPRCWLSYNAALRAVRMGYTNVLWYRGGIEAWGAGGGALAPPSAYWRRPD